MHSNDINLPSNLIEKKAIDGNEFFMISAYSLELQ